APPPVALRRAVLQRMTPSRSRGRWALPGSPPTPKPHAGQVKEAARLIADARRPVLYVGGGVLKAHASDELRVLADLTGLPVVTTLMARGAFPASHQQPLGMPGMDGTVAAVTALQRADLLVCL